MLFMVYLINHKKGVSLLTILVTGGAGYIGSHTVIELVQNGYDVVIVDNFSNSHPEVLKRIEAITNQNIPFYNINILDKDGLREVFEQHDISAVIHFAAFKAVGESVKKPLAYYHNNVEGTVSLLTVMQEFNVKKIVFSSSATVYGMQNESPLSEDLPTNEANNPYGYTKIINEHLLTDMTVADPTWSVVLLRYFNPIGAHESGMIGEDPNGIPNNLMPYITQVAVGKLDFVSVFGDDYDTPDGTGVRDYIHVVDLARGHVKAVDSVMKQEALMVYNLGTGEGYSVLDLIRTFSEVNQVDVPYEITERRAGDVATCYADPTKAKEELAWVAEKNLADMCRDSWRWQQQNPQGYQAGNMNG